ncbi:hypothetical protein BY996DRAFT_277047 [Phakopsora pachyrhizi]|nr:hypothetical protein BY996DRAFT_277047 [Phakopsora pachyrhizi]
MGSRHSLPPSVNPSAGLCVDLASKIKGDIEEDADCRPSSWAQPNLAVKNYRLETIGEAGESRSGTMTHEKLPTDYLNSLSESTDIEESEDEECFVRNRSIVRVVSQPKGMRPRRSEGSESVKTLEEMVADEDKSNELIAQSENICNDGELNFQNTSSTVDVQQPFNSNRLLSLVGLRRR